ncbi:hypothetical protein DN402_33255 [Streptomyces sp. SW4]|nr:hypothetical protein DN402_33255 [Streptomyces sp. SW4]
MGALLALWCSAASDRVLKTTQARMSGVMAGLFLYLNASGMLQGDGRGREDSWARYAGAAVLVLAGLAGLHRARRAKARTRAYPYADQDRADVLITEARRALHAFAQGDAGALDAAVERGRQATAAARGTTMYPGPPPTSSSPCAPATSARTAGRTWTRRSTPAGSSSATPNTAGNRSTSRCWRTRPALCGCATTTSGTSTTWNRRCCWGTPRWPPDANSRPMSPSSATRS